MCRSCRFYRGYATIQSLQNCYPENFGQDLGRVVRSQTGKMDSLHIVLSKILTNLDLDSSDNNVCELSSLDG